MKSRRHFALSVLWLFLSITCGSCMEFYVANIWSVGQPPHFSDLYARWWGTHELLLHRRNPYSPAVAHEIQNVIYGAREIAAYPGDPSDVSGGFAYPLYVSFLLWPTIHMQFSSVQTLVICISVLATIGSLGIWVHLLRLRRPPLELLALAFFTCGSFPVLQAIKLQNLSLIAAGMLVLSLFLLAKRHFILAGIMLAASTFKPQFTILLIPWLAIWTLSDCRRRQSLGWSFLVSMVALVGAAEWLLPGWISDFLHILRAYTHYTFGSSLLDVWFTHTWAPFSAAALLLAVFAICWPHRHDPANSPSALVTISLILAATLVFIPTLAPHTQVLLLPGFLCLLRYKKFLRSSAPLPRLMIVAAWSLLAWPWIAVTTLTMAARILSPNALLRWWELPLYTSPILPLVVAIALGFLIRRQSWPSEADLDSLV